VPMQQPILETKRLSKHFGALQAVHEVDFEVYQGEIHSIIGPNGAGKTTFFNLLTGFLLPTSGHIDYAGKEITGFSPHQISQLGIGRSFQIFSVFPDLSVLENVRIAIQARTKINYRFWSSLRNSGSFGEKAGEILVRIGLKDKQSVVARNLSSGEKRLLDIGIGLATEPKLLLLDEPTSGLAGHEISMIIGLIRAIVNPITIILIEHNIDMVLNISDKITVFNQGSIIAEGGPEEIQNNARVQEVYLGGY